MICATMEKNKGLPFPYQFKEMEPEHLALIQSLNDARPTEYIRVGPKDFVLYKPYKKDAANIYNLPLRDSDIIVASYQRSGTTWTQELIWLLQNDLDYAKAKTTPLIKRYAFLDSFMLFDADTIEKYIKNITKITPNADKEQLLKMVEFTSVPASQMLADAPSPRFIKTHLPMSLLPPTLLDTAKTVYVARDPRDVAVSCYHHALLFRTFKFPGGFRQFWNMFHNNLFVLTPYFEHVKEAWEKRNHPNMLFLFYEELSKDLPASIRRVAKFLGKQLDEKQIPVLCDHLSIDSFKKNKAVNWEEVKDSGMISSKEYFIRRGKAGGWRDYFDEEMAQQAEKWIQDNLRDTDLRFQSM